MLLDSSFYLCHNYRNNLMACSQQYMINIAPKNLCRTSSQSFLFCDSFNQKTFINEFQYNLNHQNKVKLIQQIDGQYTNFSFCDDSVLLLNRNGDFFYLNLINKNIFIAQKQHPGLYSDAQIMSLEEKFITCGGCVKNNITNQSERIIKIWEITQEDSLQQICRINTGHTKSIDHSFLFHQKVITMSCDKTLRISNLSAQSIERVISVNQDYFAGCGLDFNTIIAGGLSKQLKIYDLRQSKQIGQGIKIEKDLIQITKMIRLNDHNILISNINQLLTLDLRNMKLQEKNKYEGQRISQMIVLNSDIIVIGNKEKNFQLWKGN